MASHVLEKKVINYALKLKREKKYPSYVSSSEFLNTQKAKESGDIDPDDVVLNLKNELLKIGPLKSKFAKSSIGCCAETRSANEVMKQHPYTIPAQLSIAKAIRPKTMQEGKKCIVCKSVFK